jgi:hypothetical protein
MKFAKLTVKEVILVVWIMVLIMNKGTELCL